MRYIILFFLSFSLSFSLTLEESLNLAVKNNISAKLSLLDIKKLEEKIKEAKAGILPQLTLSYGYTRFEGDLAFGLTPKNRQSYILELNQTIFNKAIFEAIGLSKDQLELQKLIYEDVIKEIEFQTRQFFYALLYKREVVKLLGETLSFWEENYRQVEEKYKAGILPKVELVRARAERERARAELEKAIGDYKKSLEEFKKFIGYEGPLEPEGELKLLEYKDKEYEKELLEKNSRIKVARKRLEVAKRLVEVQKAQYYPSIEAFATYQGSTSRIGGNEKLVDGYTFGARLNYRIFDGFARESKIAQSKIDMLKEIENLKDLEREELKELKKTLIDIESLRAQIRASELSVEASKESLRLSTERYRYNIATQLEVLDAMGNYNRALMEYYNLILLYNVALSKLERLTQ